MATVIVACCNPVNVGQLHTKIDFSPDVNDSYLFFILCCISGYCTNVKKESVWNRISCSVEVKHNGFTSLYFPLFEYNYQRNNFVKVTRVPTSQSKGYLVLILCLVLSTAAYRKLVVLLFPLKPEPINVVLKPFFAVVTTPSPVFKADCETA